MTETKHKEVVKDLRKTVRELRDRKFVLDTNERARHRSEVARLTEKAKLKEEYYTMMLKFKDAYLREKRERKKLERKIKHVHTFYKDKLREL